MNGPLLSTLDFRNFSSPTVSASVRLSVMLSPPKPLDEIQPNLVLSYSHEWSVQRQTFFPNPWSPGEGSKGQISFDFNYKVNFKDFYAKLCVCSDKINERYKPYQTRVSFCHLGHAPGVGFGALGCPGVIFLKHGHVAYQIDREDILRTSRTEFK